MMKTCGKCGNLNAEKNSFCVKCGARLETQSNSDATTGPVWAGRAGEGYINGKGMNGTDAVYLNSGSIFGNASRVIQNIYKKLWLIALVPAVLKLIIGYTIKSKGGDIGIFLLALLLYGISVIIGNSVMLYLIDDHVSHGTRQPDIINALGKSLERFWDVFAATTIIFISCAPLFTPMLLGLTFIVKLSKTTYYYGQNKTVDIILAFVFLLIGAAGMAIICYLLIRWVLTIPLVLFQGEGATDSMKISARMVKGNYWKIIGLFFITGIIVLILNVITGLLDYGITKGIISTFVNTFIEMPLYMSVIYFIYRALKNGKDFTPVEKGNG